MKFSSKIFAVGLENAPKSKIKEEILWITKKD